MTETTPTIAGVREQPIETDLGTFSLAYLDRLDDIHEVARVSAAITRTASAQADIVRSTRDMAAFVAIQPFHRAQRPYDAAIIKIDKALDVGQIDPATAQERRKVASEKRHKAMQNVMIKPVDIWRTMDITPAMFARMLRRAPHALPDIPDAFDVMVKACADYKPLEAIRKQALKIRDEAGRILLNGDSERGIQPITNAEFARLTSLTTARVAQIRKTAQ